MVAPPQAKPKSKAEQEAQQKAARRAEQANILGGIRPLLVEDEQLLSFARARVAGGWRSKLNVGPEAFLAPFVNVALTEQRFVVQHVRYPDGRPGAALPHTYLFEKVKQVSFTDIETYGSEPACRLILHLENELYVRLRLRGVLNVESAKNMAKLFDSLTLAKRRPVPSPTHSTCPHCTRTLEQRHRFCPYCGTQQPPLGTVTGTDSHGITLATGTEPAATDTLPETVQASTLPFVSPADLAAVPIETDFAYERDDRPAEFGFGVPFTTAEEEFELGDGEITSEQTNTENAGSDVNPGTDSETGIQGSATTGVVAVEEAPDMDTAEDEYEETLEPFAPADLYASTRDTGVAFEQNEQQPFTELPFSDTPDETAGDIPLPDQSQFESEVVTDTTEVPENVTDEETEATATHEDSDTVDVPSTPTGETEHSTADVHDFTSGEQTAHDTDSRGDRHE